MPKRAYLKESSKSDSSRKSSAFSYHMKVEESDIKICKEKLMTVHGL
jgi:hypothetical protein